MLDKVYLVKTSSGDYDDYYEHVEVICLSENTAMKIKDTINQKFDEIRDSVFSIDDKYINYSGYGLPFLKDDLVIPDNIRSIFYEELITYSAIVKQHDAWVEELEITDELDLPEITKRFYK